MTVEYRSVDHVGNLYKVTDLRDHKGEPTTNPLEAETCIVHSMDQKWAMPVDQCPVYPVH